MSVILDNVRLNLDNVRLLFRTEPTNLRMLRSGTNRSTTTPAVNLSEHKHHRLQLGVVCYCNLLLT